LMANRKKATFSLKCRFLQGFIKKRPGWGNSHCFGTKQRR
jgi:hypothetical protein